jgi:hypothetical protein
MTGRRFAQPARKTGRRAPTAVNHRLNEPAPPRSPTHQHRERDLVGRAPRDQSLSADDEFSDVLTRRLRHEPVPIGELDTSRVPVADARRQGEAASGRSRAMSAGWCLIEPGARMLDPGDPHGACFSLLRRAPPRAARLGRRRSAPQRSHDASGSTNVYCEFHAGIPEATRTAAEVQTGTCLLHRALTRTHVFVRVPMDHLHRSAG